MVNPGKFLLSEKEADDIVGPSLICSSDLGFMAKSQRRRLSRLTRGTAVHSAHGCRGGSVFDVILFYLVLFERQAVSTHPRFALPDADTGRGWATLKPGAKASIQSRSPTWQQGDPTM